jgi:hypothetical protein
MSRESIEEAIEVLEDASADMLMETGDKSYYVEAIAVLRQALVDADDTSQERVDEIVTDEHEPVAWISDSPTKGNGKQLHWTKSEAWRWSSNITPLYTAPPKQWVGLTDEEVWEAIDDVLEGGGWLDVARALEQAIKRKNA